jgi:TPR repeat protein|eukprot:COSAG02_NODE_777_length_17301_cov_8.632310_4_plen_329_part_00
MPIVCRGVLRHCICCPVETGARSSLVLAASRRVRSRRAAASTAIPVADAACSASSQQPRLPPRLRLVRRPRQAGTGAAEVTPGILNAAARLLALSATGAVGLLGGYFIGSVVKEAVRDPTPEEFEAQRLEIAAERGDIEAAHALGVRYATAAGVPQDLDRAVSLYRRAADAGHAGARCRLGAAYRTGCGVEEDMVEARRNFELAADAGDVEAQFNLAVIMESELAEGGSDDGAVAAQHLQVFELYRKSADGGFAPALFNLGTLHYHGCPLKGGKSAPPDHALAARFWRQAVDAGDDRSAFNLALCYANGTCCALAAASRQPQYYVTAM